jgi:hypothetical protein
MNMLRRKNIQKISIDNKETNANELKNENN